MPKIRFEPVGETVEVEAGTRLLDAALDNNIRINHNCGGNCACATCHVYIIEGLDTLNEKSEEESEMLEDADGLRQNSRLACQSRVASDMVVEIPTVPSEPDND